MPRRYKRTYHKKAKYSIEQTNVITPQVAAWTVVEAPNETQQNSLQYAVDVVPPVEFEGMRKVKHLTLSFAQAEIEADIPRTIPVFYSIVYIPQGYQSIPLAIPAEGNAIDNYSANQFVMSSGVLEFTGGPLRIRSRLSRNLNSGDRIGLILATTVDARPVRIYIQVTYAMTLQ